MADISSITLPNGNTYYFKDATARASTSPEVFIGSTTPTGYTVWIDPDGSIVNGNEVEY